ncbi:MAG TPA: cupin domain-containing protein [Terriglobales bacterium]|nr:cupin domain-containing protein [Terriglobales bacterium]
MNIASARFCAVVLVLGASCAGYAQTISAIAKVIPLASSGKDVTPVLTGPPETATMKSGYVVLAPGKSVGKHSTEHNEELLVVFEGQGEMVFRDGSKVPVNANTAVYCPPQTEHNVTNTGSGALRYVYVVAHAQ